jgi:hypothetical protein
MGRRSSPPPAPGSGGFKKAGAHHFVDFRVIGRLVRPEPAFSIQTEDIRL